METSRCTLVIILVVTLIGFATTILAIRFATTPGDDVAILFTLHNKDEESNRRAEDVIGFYVQRMNRQNIFVVDSANRGVSTTLVPETNQAIFDQNVECLNAHNTTDFELCSLRFASAHLDFSKSKQVVKLTTKYKIRNIDALGLCAPLVLQSMKTWHQNTEVFSTQNLSDTVHQLSCLSSGVMEERMERVAENTPNVRYFPKLELVAPFYARSDGSTLPRL